MATEKLEFEQAMERLEEIVSKLEYGELPLNKSIDAFEKGSAYVKMCEEQLKKAEMRIEKIIKTKEEK